MLEMGCLSLIQKHRPICTCPMPTRAMTHEFLADLAQLEHGKPEIAPFSQLGIADVLHYSSTVQHLIGRYLDEGPTQIIKPKVQTRSAADYGTPRDRERGGGYNFIFLTAKVARLQNIESIDPDHRERNICMTTEREIYAYIGENYLHTQRGYDP